MDDDIQRIQQHDATALEQLYDRYSTHVYSVAWFVIRDVRLAEEATQNTFMKLWERPEQYQDVPGHFTAWLLTITRRCAIDLLRHERRKSDWHELWKDDMLAELPDVSADTDARWREMQLMLGQLPPEQRQVVAILASIGPTEVYHFAAFHKSLEGIFALNTRDGLEFPNLKGNCELAEAIFPEPCKFLRPEFPLTSVIRPRNTNTAGAVDAATGLVNSGLFAGQPQAFFDAVVALATAADAAVRS